MTDSTETAAFLADMADRYTAAESALLNGDPGPRMALWSRADPLSLFGADQNAQGWDGIEPVFSWLGRTFAHCAAYRNEIITAEARGDLAYTVALEHVTTSVQGAAPQSFVLRATTIFRREDGEWKIVHRHGDPATPLPSLGTFPGSRP